MPRTQQHAPSSAPSRPKILATGHQVRKNHWHFTARYENGRKILGTYLNDGALISFATYFGYDIVWENVPWADTETPREQPAAA